MTYLEAAIAVLKARRKPMSVAEITEAALRKGLIKSSGRTPEATMSAALYTHAGDSEVSGVCRVYRPGPMRAARGSGAADGRGPEAD